jgi:hypothetical protein
MPERDGLWLIAQVRALSPERGGMTPAACLTDIIESAEHVGAIMEGVTLETLTTDWLIGCDGAHSVARKQLGLQFTGEAEPNDWVLADVHIDGEIANDEISAYWHSDGVVIFFPFAPGRFRVIADLGRAKGPEKPADPSLADAQQLVDRRGPQGLRLHDPVWLSGFRINERKVAQYSKGRVLLAGDAAHIHSPAGGQGMNTGMQDAFNLAWKVALVQKGLGQSSPLLASYTTERSAVGEMGESIGAVVWLDRVPLKYAGLSYTEIWISEAAYIGIRSAAGVLEEGRQGVGGRSGSGTAPGGERQVGGRAAGQRTVPMLGAPTRQ